MNDDGDNLTQDDQRRLAELWARMDPCRLCPRQCLADRRGGRFGFCGIGVEPTISSHGPHFGEEPVLVGQGGSGTIFMTGCNLGCQFCQNCEISLFGRGRTIAAGELIRIMLELQSAGCVNINFVTPTHQSPMIAGAIVAARRQGLTVPIVYNTGGFDEVETLRLLDGLIDIYMPDVKFFDVDSAKRYCNTDEYPRAVRAAVKEMHRQVGDLQIENGLATRGLLVRHLVMPSHLDDSRRIIGFLAKEISPNTYVNVMAQYRPMHRAKEFAEIARPTTHDEWRQVYDYAVSRGLRLAR